MKINTGISKEDAVKTIEKLISGDSKWLDEFNLTRLRDSEYNVEHDKIRVTERFRVDIELVHIKERK